MAAATRTFDADSETLDYHMPTGGVYSFCAVRVTGNATFTLQTKLTEGGTYVNYYNDAGVLEQRVCTSTVTIASFNVVAQKGQYFRVISSATGDTPSYIGSANHAAFMPKNYSE